TLPDTARGRDQRRRLLFADVSARERAEGHALVAGQLRTADVGHRAGFTDRLVPGEAIRRWRRASRVGSAVGRWDDAGAEDGVAAAVPPRLLLRTCVSARSGPVATGRQGGRPSPRHAPLAGGRARNVISCAPRTRQTAPPTHGPT